MLRFKEGVSEKDINGLYEVVMGLSHLTMVQSVSAGEIFSKNSLGFSFAITLILTDLKAFEKDGTYRAVLQNTIEPLIAENGLLKVDYEFPRGISVHRMGEEVSTPEIQRWNPGRVNEDIIIDHHTITAKSEGSIWRSAVAVRPVRAKGYADFVIDMNPKPNNRSIQIGIICSEDLEVMKIPGKNFADIKGLAWQSNGGFISGVDNAAAPVVPHIPWDHDHVVGVFVDKERGIMQFFYDRKKVGPLLHLKFLEHSEIYWCVCINSGLAAVKAQWASTCPKVFLG